MKQGFLGFASLLLIGILGLVVVFGGPALATGRQQ